MTDREKLEKIKSLADKMYSRMAYLTSDTRPIRQAMDEYHQFIVNEYRKEEPKECMFTKDYYTDDDRKDLCDGCKEECKFNKKEEPVSEDLEQAIDTYLATYWGGEQEKQEWPFLKKMAIHFANWQKEQLIANAVDATVHIDAGGYPYIPQMELYDYDKDIPLAKEGDKYKVIVIKDD